MKYKGEYSPSYLAYPVCYYCFECLDRGSLPSSQEDFSWHPLFTCESVLERFRYACFTHPENSLEGQPPSLEIGACFVRNVPFCASHGNELSLLKEPPPQFPKTTLNELRFILDVKEGLPVSVPVTVCI